MMTIKPLPPVIMLGMHRSGTSLLSSMLAELGLFTGQDLQDDCESVFFIRCNDWILRQGQATWDHPGIFLKYSNDPEWRRQIANQLKRRLGGTRSARYAGAGHAATFRKFLACDAPWGWKDPRNSFTLPVWLELYPDARVIHITRHGVDVAQSLITRERRLRQRFVSLVKASAILWPRAETGAPTSPWRCATLDGAFSLWEAYMRQSRAQVQALGSRAHEIVYEDFLRNPVPVLDRLCRFIGLSVDEDRLRRVSGAVVPGRAFAHRADPALRDYARRLGPRLASLGYTSRDL